MCFPVYPLCRECRSKAYDPYKNAAHFKLRHCILVTDGNAEPALHSHLGLPEPTAENPSPIPEELKEYEIITDTKWRLCNDCLCKADLKLRKRDSAQNWRADPENRAKAAKVKKDKREALKAQNAQRSQGGTAGGAQGTTSAVVKARVKGKEPMTAAQKATPSRIPTQGAVQNLLGRSKLDKQNSRQNPEISKAQEKLPSRPKVAVATNAGLTTLKNTTNKPTSGRIEVHSSASRESEGQKLLNTSKQNKIPRKITVPPPAKKETAVERSTAGTKPKAATRTYLLGTLKTAASSKGSPESARGRTLTSAGTSTTSRSTSRSAQSTTTASTAGTGMSSQGKISSVAGKAKSPNISQSKSPSQTAVKNGKNKPRKLEIRTRR